MLIDIFSIDSGRFSIIAKGIKREKSQSQRAILQPFGLLNIEYSGRGDLKILRQAELINRPTKLPIKAIACGYYINELLIRSLQDWQESSDLFEDYQLAIKSLILGENHFKTLRNFEVSLLSELGLAPDWQTDILGNQIEPEAMYLFNPQDGFQKINKSELDYQVKKSYTGQSLLDLNSGNYHPNSQKDCQHVTQMLLRQVIGQKPLESRKLWV